METDAEVTKLREELAKLRQELAVVRRKIGLYDEEPGDSGYVHLDAEGIAVRTKKENIPMVLRAHDDGAVMWMNDSKHISRVRVEVDDKAGVFELRNAEGNVIVSIGEAEDGSGMVFVFDKDGKPRAGLRVNEFGGVVTATNPSGAAEAMLLARAEGGTVMVADAEGRPAAKMHGDEKGGTVMTTEKTGAPMTYMTSASQRGTVAVFSEHGDQVAAMSSDDNGGAMILYDSDGNVRTSLP